MVDNVTTLKRLMSMGNQVININQMIMPHVMGNKLSVSHASGVMRFKIGSDYKINFPRYKYLVLLDDRIYTFNKFHKNMSLDVIMDFNSVIEFDNEIEARNAWEKYVNNPIVVIN